MSSTHKVAIIQARMGSTRLPGKVLENIGPKPMLQHVVERTSQAASIDKVVIATPDTEENEPIVNLADKMELPVFRGSEHDVLDRYYQAAMDYSADIVIRNTGDCPFTEPSLVQSTLESFEAKRPDYADQLRGQRTLPRGVTAGVVSAKALERAWEEAEEVHHRYHVTSYIYSNPNQFEILAVSSPSEDYSHYRLTVDHPEDLELARKVYEHLENKDAGWRQIVALLENKPDLAAINSEVEQKALEEG